MKLSLAEISRFFLKAQGFALISALKALPGINLIPPWIPKVFHALGMFQSQDDLNPNIFPVYITKLGNIWANYLNMNMRHSLGQCLKEMMNLMFVSSGGLFFYYQILHEASFFKQKHWRKPIHSYKLAPFTVYCPADWNWSRHQHMRVDSVAKGTENWRIQGKPMSRSQWRNGAVLSLKEKATPCVIRLTAVQLQGLTSVFRLLSPKSICFRRWDAGEGGEEP